MFSIPYVSSVFGVSVFVCKEICKINPLFTWVPRLGRPWLCHVRSYRIGLGLCAVFILIYPLPTHCTKGICVSQKILYGSRKYVCFLEKRLTCDPVGELHKKIGWCRRRGIKSIITCVCVHIHTFCVCVRAPLCVSPDHSPRKIDVWEGSYMKQDLPLVLRQN